MIYKLDVNASEKLFCELIPNLFEALRVNSIASEEPDKLEYKVHKVITAPAHWPSPTDDGSSHHRVDVWRRSSDELQHRHPHRERVKLSLKVYGTSSERCIVIARCDSSEMEALFVSIVSTIAQLWPETVAQLKRQGFQFPGDLKGNEKIPEASTKVDCDQVPFPGFPTTPEGVERWRKSFEVIEETRAEYSDRYNRLDEEEPEPTLEDLRVALRREVREWCRWDKAPQEDTIRRIIRAGREGHL